MHSGADNNDKRERVLDLLEEEALLRSQLTVTASDYQGSRTAAQVLLSLYDGSEWHMDLTDLGVLDWGYLQHALIVIRGRLVLGQSVEAAIDNGDQVFSHLCTLWAGLRNDRRYSNWYDD